MGMLFDHVQYTDSLHHTSLRHLYSTQSRHHDAARLHSRLRNTSRSQDFDQHVYLNFCFPVNTQWLEHSNHPPHPGSRHYRHKSALNYSVRSAHGESRVGSLLLHFVDPERAVRRVDHDPRKCLVGRLLQLTARDACGALHLVRVVLLVLWESTV